MRIRNSIFAGAAAVLILGGAAAADSVRRLALPTNDLVSNPVDGRLYASIPSRAGDLGNSVAAIDPQTGAIVGAIPVGSEPGKLALAEDGRTLYVALDGAGAVRRVDLASQTAGLQFSLGREGQFDWTQGPNRASDLKVLPGHPESVVVSRISAEASPWATGVAVYDNGVPRPQILFNFRRHNVLAFGQPPSWLYGYDQEDSEIGFRRMTVDAAGVLPSGSIPGLISGVVDIQFDQGRIYTSSGFIIDPESAMVLGRFPGVPSPSLGFPPGVLLLADGAAERVYFLVQGGATPGVLVFDPQTRALLGRVDVPYPHGSISSLVRWGDDGLAFRSSSGELFLIESALVPAGDLALRFPSAGPGTRGAGVGGGVVMGTVTLRAPAPAGGSGVALQSEDPARAAVPPLVTVPAGAVTATFPVITAAVARSTPVTLTAATGAATRRTVLQLLPAESVSLLLRSDTVVGGALATGTVTLAAPAPPGGLVVSLASDSPAAAAVPATVAVPAGATRACFSVATSPVLQTTSVMLSAAYGGAADSVALTVLAPAASRFGAVVTQIPLPASDLIYDPLRGKIYASVPGTGGSLANHVAVIDPITGAIERSFLAGNDPGKLALSDDGSALYVALEGGTSVRRFDPATGTGEPPFSLGTGLNGPAAVADLKVAPGHPETVAVARIDPLTGGEDRVVIYDHGVARPMATSWTLSPTVLAFGASAARLYGYDNRNSLFEFYRMTVDPSGVFVQDSAPQLVYNFEVGIQYGDGLLDTSSGRVIDPEALELRGTYDAIPFGALMAADSALGRVFFLTPDGSRWWLRAYEQRTFRPLGAVEIPDVSGPVGSLIRCGAGGLAFRAGPDQVLLVRTPLAPVDALSVTLDPEAAAGGLSVAGTVTLGRPAPAGGAVVALATDRLDLVTLPPQVTVAEGSTTVTFPVSTAPVGQRVSAQITASTAGASGAAVLTVRPDALLSVSLSPESVVGGETAAGTVELGLPAPPGGLAVMLASNHPAVTVPATVLVPAGETRAAFVASTEPVPVDSSAVLSATLEGVTRAAGLRIQAPVLRSIHVVPSIVTGGDPARGTVVISSPAPAGGLIIPLGSSSNDVRVPESVTVPAGGTFASFPITTRPVAEPSTVSVGTRFGGAVTLATLSLRPRP